MTLESLKLTIENIITDDNANQEINVSAVSVDNRTGFVTIIIKKEEGDLK